MTNPFEVPDATYTVLVNGEQQHCLWPAYVDVPPGWSTVHGPTDRDSCLEYVRSHWSDLRPRSLAHFLDASM